MAVAQAEGGWCEMSFLLTYILLLCCYAVVHGFSNGIAYSGKGAEAFKWNEHGVFVVERGLFIVVPLITPLFVVFEPSFWPAVFQLLLVLLAFVFMFSFFHNESYNFARLYEREQYKYDQSLSNWQIFLKCVDEFEFGYQSATSTAKNEYNHKQRVRQLLIGCGIITVVLIYNIFR